MGFTNHKFKEFFLILLLAALLLSQNGCGGEECKVKFKSLSPSSNSVTVITGKFINFFFSLKGCGEKVKEIRWEFDSKEFQNDTTMVTVRACPDLTGIHTLTLHVKTSHHSLSKTWKIEIKNAPDPDKPECYSQAIATIQKGIEGVKSDESPTGMNMSDAYSCLAEYLKKSPCNLEANMAAGIAHLTLTLANLPAHLLLALSAFNNGVETLIKTELDPVINYFSTVGEHANSKFKFTIDRLTIDIPQTGITVNFSGEWDRGDALFFAGVMKVLKGALTTGLAYNGFYELPLIFMEKDWQASLISRLERDETFLMLTGKDGKKGEQLLQEAQNELVDGLNTLIEAFTSIESESDPQVDPTNPLENDIIKYWDCGKDAICPTEYSDYPEGDPREPFKDDNGNGKYDPGEEYEDLNHNGRWNDSWQNTGSDEGENDGQYTDGEPIGTEIIAGEEIRFPGGTRLTNILTTLRDNIKGPDPLDLDKLFGVPKGTMKTQFEQLGIPYPEIRLSEFFVTPSNLRNLLPLYSRSGKYFFNQPEEEKFYDYGIDGLKDEDEPYYDPATNPDPDHDDYDIETNPSDGYDNDSDGYIDQGDPDGDFGTEGNNKFDWVDQNVNQKQDPGEPSEPFVDTGIITPEGIYGKDNGIWDQLDTDHKWPRGDDVGGPTVNIDIDPKNGTIKDEDQRLIDKFYLFFPDATFSRVLVFPDPTVNIDGKTLTRNAELFRFIGKILQNANYLLSF